MKLLKAQDILSEVGFTKKGNEMIDKEKMRFTYDLWLQKYKGKTVHDLTVEEHTKWSKEYQAWKTGNVEKL